MNIALCHYRVGETDGVSLEMNKWKYVLEKQGHKVYFLAGDKGCTDSYIIPELSLSDRDMMKIHFNAYYELRDFDNEKILLDSIEKQADIIEEKLFEFIEQNSIDVLIPNNILSLGHHISAAIAIYKIAKKKKIKLICHHHDFYWEREVFNNPTCEIVKNILKTYFPPKSKNIKHCVINSIAGEQLKARKKIDSVVVPNIFDFYRSDWTIDEYNSDFRARFKIKNNDLVFLQATRITDRKAIELAIDLTATLNKQEFRNRLIGKKLYNDNTFTSNSEIYLVLPGLSGEAESATGYKERLKKHAEKKNVKMLWCNDFVEDERRYDREKGKIYSLWDIYANCDFITYPSIQEGWGNQFLEGLFAKKPMVVFEYPVFISDIKSTGFKYISLDNKFTFLENRLVKVGNDVLKKTAGNCIDILLDKKNYKKIVETNFQLGKNNYSLDTLNHILKKVI